MNEAAEAMEEFVEPNARRAVWIEGRLDESLVERLRPEIAELCRSSEPITVFLNSSGGRPEAKHEIVRLLRTPGTDGSHATIITVAAREAGSAAANLLCAGDFAVAHSGSALLWHGGRWPLSDLLEDGDSGLILARTLPTFREMAAAELAANCARRFMAIVSAVRPLFASQSENADPMQDVKSFQLILRGKLSEVGQKVLDRAIELDECFNGVLLQFQKRLRRGRVVTNAHLRKLMLHAAIEYESHSDDERWDGGLAKISDHFFALNSYFDFERLHEWIATRTRFEAPHVEADYELRFRQFFLSICRALQQGENRLAPADAVWLGLIDSIRNGVMQERPRCPWCREPFASWVIAKQHTKNCAQSPRPRWKAARKRRGISS